MAESSSSVESIAVDANGFSFTGIAAGPAEGDLVLLLHGWPQFADSWTPVVRELGDLGYRAVAVDQRGYSTAARPEQQEAYAVEHLVSDVLACADALGRKKFHLVTHDWGAIVGWHAARAHPDRLMTFTAMAVPHPNAVAEAFANDADQRERGAYVNFFRQPNHVAEKALLGNDAAALRACYEGKVAPETVDENVRRLKEPGAMTAVLNWYRAFDWTAKIGDVSVPTLYIYGSNDRAIGSHAARSCHAFVSGLFQFEVVDTTHWIVDEIPSETVALLRPHLAAARAGVVS